MEELSIRILIIAGTPFTFSVDILQFRPVD